MRWRYCETAAELAERIRITREMDAWWATFKERATALSAELRSDENASLRGWLPRMLKAIHPDLTWEIGPALEGSGHRLVITPDSRYELRPIVQDLLERAPPIPGWEFYGARIAVPADAKGLVEARTGVDIGPWRIIAIRRKLRIHVRCVSPNTSDVGDPNAQEAAVVLVECLVGEEILNKWIATVKVIAAEEKGWLGLAAKPNDAAKDSIPLNKFQPLVTGIVKTITAEMPSKPRFQFQLKKGVTDPSLGRAYELEPKKAADYPRTDDVFFGTIMKPNQRLVEAVRRDYFDSSILSRCGDVFCYLKFERIDLDAAHSGVRDELQLAIDKLLWSKGYGCTIGAATGLRYYYIDLAMVNLLEGIECVREALQDAEAPVRSWILFHDSSLRTEWVGVYPETPPPPE